MTVAAERAYVMDLFEAVEAVEAVATTLDETDERRATLLSVVAKDLGRIPPVRPSIAADLLRLSEPTVRSWAREGVLIAVTNEPRLLLDPKRLHQVLHLVRALREAGRTQGLLDAVYRRLVDSTWLDNAELIVSLEQMRRGEGTRVRTASSALE